MRKLSINKIKVPELYFLFAIMLLAILFRIYKLMTAPDWYQDEGEFIHLADNLSKGNFNYMGIRNSMLLIGRPPLFFWVLAGLFKLFGTDIVILRGLSVFCSIAIIVVAYIFTRQALGKKPAIYTAFLLAIIPDFIYFNRMGFTYNWTALWMLVSIYALWKYLEQQDWIWIIVSCLAAGIAFASDYLGMMSVLVVILFLVLYHPKRSIVIPIALVPMFSAMLPTFIISPSSSFRYMISSFSGTSWVENNLGYQFSLMLQAYPEMFRRQPWIILGIIGLFLIPESRLRGLLICNLLGILALFSLNRTLALHYLVPIWPLALIGLGYFFDKAVTYFFTNVKSSLINMKLGLSRVDNTRIKSTFGSIISTLLVFTFLFLPISYMLILDLKGYVIEPINPSSSLLQLGWIPLYIPADDAESIAMEIEKNTSFEDFVIAPDIITWMLPCRSADIRTVNTYELDLNDVDQKIGLKDFVINSSLSSAKYVVVNDTWRYFYAYKEEYKIMLDQVTSWPIVMSKGNVQLYCNPSFCK